MKPTIIFIGLTTYIVFLILVGCATWSWFFRRKYTRERFAFYGLPACIFVVINAFTCINANISLLELPLILADFMKTGEMNIPSLSTEKSALVTLLSVSVLFLFYKIHKDWDGAVSRETYLARQDDSNKDFSRILREFQNEFNRVIQKNRLSYPMNFGRKLPKFLVLEGALLLCLGQIFLDGLSSYQSLLLSLESIVKNQNFGLLIRKIMRSL